MASTYGEYKYDHDVCWQYKVKKSKEDHDIEKYGHHPNVSIGDLDFKYIDKEDKEECRRLVDFIEKYEWLGKMPVWITHRFAAYYDDILVGVIIMATPYRNSELLGKDLRKTEKLIARGATNSIAPKNAASWLISQSMKWMVDNTEFRLFTAYADPEALELGTVYQACNFYYLGQKYGGGYTYLDPRRDEWFGSSYFSQRSVIKRVAIAGGIPWKKRYIKKNKTGRKRVINWDALEKDGLKQPVKDLVKEYKSTYTKYKTSKKHKYAYVLGQDKRETRQLRKKFEELNPEFVNLDYPENRGE